MGRLVLDSPFVEELKKIIKVNLLRADEAGQIDPMLADTYASIAESNMELLYAFQDIRFDKKRKLWLPEIKPIPIIDEKLIGDMFVLDSGQGWTPCSVCGYMGLYQYTDTYATFVCYNPPCRSWYEIYKNQHCYQCSNPSVYRYYYDNRVAPHVRCVTQWQQCMQCSYHIDRTYYWYYD